MSAGLLASISLLLSGMAVGAANAVGRYPVAAQAGARAVIASPAKPVGYDAQVHTQAGPASYVGLIEKGGADSLRDDVPWAYVEQTQGQFDWSVPDQIVTEAAEHHLHPLLIVDESPTWASGGSKKTNPDDWFWLPPKSAAAYGQFAAMVAARYGPGGVFWQENRTLPEYLPAGLELWNEENLAGSWGKEVPDPALYAAMVKAAYPLIKQADPTMTVVLGGLSPGGGYNEAVCGTPDAGHDAAQWNPVNYLQTLYADGIQGSFDAVGWHAYNFKAGQSATQMLAYGPCSAWSQMSATPVSARSLMTANGDGAKKVWITEAGAPTCTAGLDQAHCVSVAQQAALAADEAKWRTLSWAGGYYWYDIRDKTTDPADPASHFGAVYAGNLPKPAYKALLKAWRAAPKPAGPLTLTVPASRGVRSVAFSPDGKFIAAGAGNGHVYIWPDSTRRLASTLADPGSKGVSSVTFNAASSLIAAGDANGHVYLWAGGKVHAALKVPSGKAVLSVAFSRDGKYIAAGDAAGHVYAWLVSTQRLAGTMTDPGGKGASSVTFNPASSLLVSGDANGHTYLWDHKLTGTLADPASRGVSSVAFSSNSEYLAAGDANGKVFRWLVSKRSIAQTLTDPAGKAVESVAFNPGGTLLAAGDAHGHVYLWTAAAKFAGNLTDPGSGAVRAVTFSPNGHYLAATSASGRVYLWPVALGASPARRAGYAAKIG